MSVNLFDLTAGKTNLPLPSVTAIVLSPLSDSSLTVAPGTVSLVESVTVPSTSRPLWVREAMGAIVAMVLDFVSTIGGSMAVLFDVSSPYRRSIP